MHRTANDHVVLRFSVRPHSVIGAAILLFYFFIVPSLAINRQRRYVLFHMSVRASVREQVC